MDELEAEQQDHHVSKRVSALLRLCGAFAAPLLCLCRAFVVVRECVFACV